MKKLLLFSLLCMFGLGVDLFAQFDTSMVIIGYTPEQRCFMRLFSFSNNFGYARVDYSIAEVKLICKETTQNIALRANVQEHCKLRGNSNQGEDQKLRDVSRSDDFVVNKKMFLNFHRIMNVYTTCCYRKDIDSTPTFWDDPEYIKLPESTKTWGCPKGSILDRSEWVIELASASTGERLFVVDSVGILPNPETNYSIPYGTNPLNSDITMAIPEHLTGQNVFLRVSPRRYGPTPAGMGLNEFYSCTNASIFQSLKDGIRIGQSGMLSKQIDDYVFDKCKVYIDSLISVGECVPFSLTNAYGTSAEQYEFLKKKYPHCYTDEVTKRYLAKYEERMKKIKTPPAQSNIQSVSFSNSTKEFEVLLNPKTASNDMTFKLSAVDYTESASGSIGNLKPGKFSFKIPMPQAAKGVYNLSIEDESGKLYGQTTVMVE